MVNDGVWPGWWGVDPRPWLLSCDEAPARWIALTGIEGLPGDDPQVTVARQAAVDGEVVGTLVARLPAWDDPAGASSHASPAYLPNLLHLLADLGVSAGDHPAVDVALDALERHRFEDGRFASFGRAPGTPEPVWHSLPCDTHSITEVLVRYGRRDRPAVRAGLDRIAADLAATRQGPAWTCVPDADVRWRGPGRKGDICPQVTLEALRLLARLPTSERPEGTDTAASTMLTVWRRRGSELPYSFGHGVRFKTVKWPPLWYGVYWVLDTLGRFPQLWRSGTSADRRAIAELVACLVAYNVAADGKVTPRSVYRGFAETSFGQKQRPSPIATALLAAVAVRFVDLADDIAAVDVTALTSSKGGEGTARPPR
ncbi:MAG: hypothetical protein EA387_02665 [Nitriliruptor sp.]|nr:MAG: hypothetical protein EA387_02665 [Nitriliruptor sp.]